MRSIIPAFLLAAAFAFSLPAKADATGTELEKALTMLGVDADPATLPPAPLHGFVEITRGTQVLYLSLDGRLLVKGDVLSLAEGRNLTEEVRGGIRNTWLAAIPEDERIVLGAKRQSHRLTVFVDTNCPYCAELHRRADEYHAAGIELQFLFYPRSGPGSDSWHQAVAVWCADDRKRALADALAGVRLPERECSNPVAAHHALATRLQLKGTPALITETGAIRYGVVDINELLQP